MRLGTGGALSVPSIPRQGSALRGQIQGLNDPPKGLVESRERAVRQLRWGREPLIAADSETVAQSRG